MPAKRKSTRVKRSKKPKGPPAAVSVLHLVTSYWTSQCLFVVAKLGVADALAEGPLTPEAIAAQVGAHAPSLRRVLRALASLGVFAEDTKGRFRLTPLARTLQSDHPQSMRDFALMIVDDWNWQPWGALSHGVETGESPFDRVHGVPLFQYLQKNPDKERIFAGAMRSISAPQNLAVANAYPFGELETLVDVGGAHGHLLAAILRKHKKVKGVLYDQPQVAAAAKESGFVTAPELRGRGTIQGGNFFESVPRGADGYIMKYIIHDWDDEKCIRILTNCREAMAKGGRILVAEAVLQPGNHPDWAKLLDIMMLVGPRGQERTRTEFRDLFAKAGLKLRRVIPTASPITILEGVAT